MEMSGNNEFELNKNATGSCLIMNQSQLSRPKKRRAHNEILALILKNKFQPQQPTPLATTSQSQIEAVQPPPPKRGRIPVAKPKGHRHCCYSTCSSDSHKHPDVTFIPFSKPCKELRDEQLALAVGEKIRKRHKTDQCLQCNKCQRWIKLCNRQDGRFSRPIDVTKNTYICNLHFVNGVGPSAEYPDPLTPAASFHGSVNKTTPMPKRPPLRERIIQQVTDWEEKSDIPIESHEQVTENQKSDVVIQTDETLFDICCKFPKWCLQRVENSSTHVLGRCEKINNLSVITLELFVHEDFKLELKALGERFEVKFVNELLQSTDDISKVPRLLKSLEKLHLCCGISNIQQVNCFVNSMPMVEGRLCGDGIVKSVNCKIISYGTKCQSCMTLSYKLTRKMNNEQKKSSQIQINCHTNSRYMTHQTIRLKLTNYRRKHMAAKKKITRLQKKVNKLMKESVLLG